MLIFQGVTPQGLPWNMKMFFFQPGADFQVNHVKLPGP